MLGVLTNKQYCIICQILHLDSEANEVAAEPRVHKGKPSLRLKKLQLKSLLASLRSKQSKFSCALHKNKLNEVKKVLRKLHWIKKQSLQNSLLDAYENWLLSKQELKLAVRLEDHDLAGSLRIKIFQQSCLVAQRARRLKELARKPVRAKHLDEELLELLRKKDESVERSETISQGKDLTRSNNQA